MLGKIDNRLGNYNKQIPRIIKRAVLLTPLTLAKERFKLCFRRFFNVTYETYITRVGLA